MVRLSTLLRSSIWSALLGVTLVQGMSVTNLYDPYLKPAFHTDTTFQGIVFAERGTHAKAFSNDCCVNPLRIWNSQQDALKMLSGFDPLSTKGQLLLKLDASDDGVRGNFLVDGCLQLLVNAAFAARYRVHDDFILSAYLPVQSMRLTDVTWCNLTKDLNDEDQRVRSFLTDDFFAHVEQLGCLNLNGWKRSGLGDLLLEIQWMRDFPQSKPMLTNVRLNGRLGLSCPTGLKQDEDRIFAQSFGHDGAFGLLFGGGLDALLGKYMQVGFDVTLLHLFGNTRIRRIKTDPCQTELLLLQKACAYKDWGLTQQFNLYLEFRQFINGVSFRVDYQFLKHDDDALALETYDFSTSIANTARSLEDWTSHLAVFKLTYDDWYRDTDACIVPQISLYASVPFDGKRSVRFTTIGAVFSLEF